MKIIKAIFLGILAAAGALVFEAAVSTFISSSIPFLAFAAIEEFFIAIMIWRIARDSSGKNIMPSSAFVGIGFSLVEIFLNSLTKNNYPNQISLSFLGLILIHLATALIFGYYFSSRQKPAFPGMVFVFLLATILHFFFNLSVLYDFNRLVVFGILAILIASLSLKLLRVGNYTPLPIEKE